MSVSGEEPYSTIFACLNHPVRRKILRMLSQKPMSFSEMLEVLGVSSSFLTYHIENLGELIGKTDSSKYRLSSFGEAAIATMTRVEDIPTTVRQQESKSRKVARRSVAIVLSMICMVLAASLVGAFAYYIPLTNDKNNTISSLNSRVMSLQNQTVYDNITMVNLQSQIDTLKSQIAELENKVSSDNATIVNLRNQLNWLLNWSTSLQETIMSNPSVWENRMVVLEGVLGLIVNLPFQSLPYGLILSSGNQSIGVSWNGSWTDILALGNESVQSGMLRVYGVVRKGYDVISGIQIVNGNNTYNEFQVNEVYYVEAQRIEPL